MDLLDPVSKTLFESSPKKKKRYILLLLSKKNADESRIHTIEKAIHTAIPDFILLRFEDPHESMKAILVKNIEILFIDSSFFDDDKTSVEYAYECKKRKKCPVFFIAKDEIALIKEYQKKLYAYEEFDDYFKDPVDFVEISKKLKRAATTTSRKAKRFLFEIPITIYRLNSDKKYKVTLTDISLIGFGIYSNNTDEIFRHNEQIQAMLPLSEFKLFHPIYGDFLHLSGKVRQISINGKKIGFSIEHINPIQAEILMGIMEKITQKMKMTKIIPTAVKMLPPTS